MSYRRVDHRCVDGATARRAHGAQRRLAATEVSSLRRPHGLAWIDFLQLDQCPEHGVWLDPGELVKALASAQEWPELKSLLAALRPRGND
jgi:hypothetical protein